MPLKRQHILVEFEKTVPKTMPIFGGLSEWDENGRKFNLDTGTTEHYKADHNYSTRLENMCKLWHIPIILVSLIICSLDGWTARLSLNLVSLVIGITMYRLLQKENTFPFIRSKHAIMLGFSLFVIVLFCTNLLSSRNDFVFLTNNVGASPLLNDTSVESYNIASLASLNSLNMPMLLDSSRVVVSNNTTVVPLNHPALATSKPEHVPLFDNQTNKLPLSHVITNNYSLYLDMEPETNQQTHATDYEEKCFSSENYVDMSDFYFEYESELRSRRRELKTELKKVDGDLKEIVHTFSGNNYPEAKISNTFANHQMNRFTSKIAQDNLQTMKQFISETD